jgi:predicted nucleotidyltransferase component of viral defense system
VTRSKGRNAGHSVFERLSHLARQRGEDLNLILARYVVERLLYRLSVSPYADRFVLKGAHLFLVWTGDLLRPTRDADFLGFGASDVPHIASVLRDICTAVKDGLDGIEFLPDTVGAEEIRENQDYGGVRVRLEAAIHTARVHVQLDVAFGDAVVPAVEDAVFPTLLEDMPAPHIRAYPRYAVVAEKLEAMIRLGIANSRMKDFYDLWLMSRTFEFDGKTLTAAVQATLEHRRTPLSVAVPTAFTEAFRRDEQKRAQWRAFVRRSRLSGAPVDVDTVVQDLAVMLQPVMDAVRDGNALEAFWPPDGPWLTSFQS